MDPKINSWHKRPIAAITAWSGVRTATAHTAFLSPSSGLDAAGLDAASEAAALYGRDGATAAAAAVREKCMRPRLGRMFAFRDKVTFVEMYFTHHMISQ